MKLSLALINFFCHLSLFFHTVYLCQGFKHIALLPCWIYKIGDVVSLPNVDNTSNKFVMNVYGKN
jgi:hypothetical protein